VWVCLWGGGCQCDNLLCLKSVVVFDTDEYEDCILLGCLTE